jgi:hypothetical protein
MNVHRKFVAALLLGILLASGCVPTAPAETSVSITQPAETAKVEQFLTVDGESQLLPKDSVIWLVIYLPVTGRYYPQNFPADIQANGEWSATAYIGQPSDSGLAADVIAVLAEKSAQAAFNNYLTEAKNKNDYSGLEKIPEGATIYDRVSVIRK